jgi:demethylmenaquinone methyltransferase/2-methoxy-6-polyprenyl-1,4-benzoquinol methylase
LPTILSIVYLPSHTARFGLYDQRAPDIVQIIASQRELFGVVRTPDINYLQYLVPGRFVHTIQGTYLRLKCLAATAPPTKESSVTNATPATTIQQQIAYYRARAAEYDEWWYRAGRYDHGAAANARWFAEAATMQAALRALGQVADALELACGTGIWTRELTRIAARVTAIDAAPEALAINRAKLADPRVTYTQADLFAWAPDRAYDLALMAFWLSHAPPDRLDAFLTQVARAVKPGGRVFIVDSRHAATSGALNHPLPDAAGVTHQRALNDGQQFTIVKVFYDPAALTARLATLGFTTEVHTTPEYFYSLLATKVRDHEERDNHEGPRY